MRPLKPNPVKKLPGRQHTAADLVRADGRPEVYDVQDTPGGYECIACKQFGTSPKFKRGEVFLTQARVFICKEHLPGNVVIFDPISGTCRSKDGQNVWKE